MTPGQEYEPLRPVAELFTRSTSALWATTYNVDLRLVTEFLLPALGAPPLNVTVLADHHRLGRSLARIGADRVDTLATVNRRWLLRGVRPPGAIFHPKSYLSVSARRATLLVGSGNLSVDGLDEGREVFTAFRSGTAAGDRAIATWRGWMRRLLAWFDDPMLARRFADLEDRLPPVTEGASEGLDSVLLHNLDMPLVTQLTALVRSSGVEELHLAAPFYDRDGAAVARLVAELRPRRVDVYLGGQTSVDGPALGRSLDGHDVRFRGLEPDEFTHAKLVGITVDDRAWVLSGSANLSRSALLRSAADGGNVELAVLTKMAPAEARIMFAPPCTRIVDLDAAFVQGLVVIEEETVSDLPVRLVRAESLDDGRVRVVSEPSTDPSWFLADHEERHRLVRRADGQTGTASTVRGRLVWLVGEDGAALSHPVVVDDVATLATVLGEDPSEPDRSRPRELMEADLDTVLGRALARLQRELVMDVSERADTAPGAGSNAGSGTDGDDAEADDDFWDRLTREHLAADPRASRYRQFASGGGRELIEQLLESLRARVPPGSKRPVARGGSASGALEPAPDPTEPPRRWSNRARLRVQARNVLRRWAVAQSDPRLVWVDPLAPVVNFTAIVRILAELRLVVARTPAEVELTDADLEVLWWEWLATFVGTGRRDGYLDRLSPEETGEVLRRLDRQVCTTAAWLCWLTVRPGHNYRSRVIQMQPVLKSALERGLLLPTTTSAESARAIVRKEITVADLERDLRAAADFLDDELWCDLTAEELGLTGLRFERRHKVRSVDVLLYVNGISEPLRDPRLPRLLDAVQRYRGCAAVALYAAEGSTDKSMGQMRATGSDWRIIYRQGEPLIYLSSRAGDLLDSFACVDAQRMQQLTDTGTPLAAIFSDAAS